ncbi:hypothetical protein RJ55_01322 [Drechmeria coniospora]|nr:hypothetical protein RJ55_01322 [Drechmeria coniospora]
MTTTTTTTTGKEDYCRGRGWDVTKKGASTAAVQSSAFDADVSATVGACGRLSSRSGQNSTSVSETSATVTLETDLRNSSWVANGARRGGGYERKTGEAGARPPNGSSTTQPCSSRGAGRHSDDGYEQAGRKLTLPRAQPRAYRADASVHRWC